ncbi:MAG: hydrolase [Micavibrio sp.]|nr:MAG: hydrolase [Micavibrio sp.]
MSCFQAKGAEFSYEMLGDGGPHVIWAHGWGQDHKALLPLASSLEKTGHHILIDFPGFGSSPEPSEIWGTENYADAVAEWLKAQSFGPVIWVGHSFGCRVGLQLAARHPELVSGLFLIAAAGLKRKRPLHKQLYLKTRICIFKLAKKILGAERAQNKFGSRDYKQTSGVMRSIFVKVVNEDLAKEAKMVSCPVKLVYGGDDNETPPEIGRRLEKLIPDAEMVLLEGEDHYSILSNGRHQAVHLLQKLMQKL